MYYARHTFQYCTKKKLLFFVKMSEINDLSMFFPTYRTNDN